MNKFIKLAVAGLCSLGLVLNLQTPAPASTFYETIDEREQIIQYADQFLGNPYSWGGRSLIIGCDCSHFVWLILTDTGYYNGDYAVSDDWVYLGQPVDSIDDAVIGDVIVYPGHVALYDGQGLIMEARSSACGITHDRQYNYTTILAIRHFEKIQDKNILQK